LCDEHGDWGGLTDLNLAEITESLRPHGQFRQEEVYSAIKGLVATRESHHPLRDRFRELPDWDHERRVPEIFTDRYFKAAPLAPFALLAPPEEQRRYLNALGKNFLAMLVGRPLRPGCRLKAVPVLIGDVEQSSRVWRPWLEGMNG
jgi:hypothetical protein